MIETSDLLLLPQLVALGEDSAPLPLQKVKLRAKVLGLDTEVKLVHTFTNVLDAHLEVTYVFPLPAHYAVHAMEAVLGGRKVSATLKERSEARADYQEALSNGQRAALAEEERAEVFTLSLGNIAPGERAEIKLELTGRLSVESSEVTFRFPTVVAPRYQNAETADSRRVNVPRSERVNPSLDFKVKYLKALLGDAPLHSSLHSVTEKSHGDWVSLEFKTDERLDRDIIIRHPLPASVTQKLTVAPDAGGEGGTWALEVLTPPEYNAKPRTVIVALDRSGSMHGWKMVSARRAAARIIDSLTDADQFSLVAFDNELSHAPGVTGLVQASDVNRFRAVSWLSSLEARGGTDIMSALNESLKLLEDRPNAALVLVTDGQIANESAALKEVGSHSKNARIFSVGIDRAVNAGFLESLARNTGGLFTLVESEERLSAALGSITRTITAPVHECARVIHGEDVLEDLTPREQSDIFPGVPFLLRGRYEGTLTPSKLAMVTSKDGDLETHKLEVHYVEGSTTRRLWARSILRDLTDSYFMKSDSKLEKKIVDLSLAHSVLTKFTAFVAVDTLSQDIIKSDALIQPVLPVSGWVSSTAMSAGAARAGVMMNSVHAPAPLAASSTAPLAEPAAFGTSSPWGEAISSHIPASATTTSLSNSFLMQNTLTPRLQASFKEALTAGDVEKLSELLKKLPYAFKVSAFRAAVCSFIKTRNEKDRLLALSLIKNSATPSAGDGFW